MRRVKKVRRTIDFLAQNTHLRAVVNATGTPYFERQPLRDVVVWYGLGEGIRDGVLKELAGNIKVFDLDDAGSDLVSQVVDDFFATYGNVQLPNGAPARLALYFPNIETRDAFRPAVDAALALRGIGTDTVLAIDNKSSEATRRTFEAVARDPTAPQRVLLLVNMGTEGWNCPSLFACALVRKLATSNNFVLQAATRCLRQVPGNTRPARVYLTRSNRKTLEDQLAETYGTSLQELNLRSSEHIDHVVTLHKPRLPPLIVTQRIVRLVRRPESPATAALSLAMPDVPAPTGLGAETYTLIETEAGVTRMQRLDAGDHMPPGYVLPAVTVYTAASRLATNAHLETMEVLFALRSCYGQAQVPEHHLEALGAQIERQRGRYDEQVELVDVAIELIKPEGFDMQPGSDPPVYTARISVAKDRAHLYMLADDTADAQQARALSFHYEGYNFDCVPERRFLEWVLEALRTEPHQVEGLWFTGGFTDPAKTDLRAEYLGDDGRWHHYTPDFVTRRRDGRHLVVEIKKDEHSSAVRADLQRLAQGAEPISLEGRKAVALKRWERLNPDRLRYEVLFADQELRDEGKPQVLAFMRDHG